MRWLSDPKSKAEPISLSELLVRVAASRDIRSFEILFNHFAPRVTAYMARVVGDGPADELMQETMIAVWNKAGQFDPTRGSAGTWIFTIARNLRIDAYRRDRQPNFDPHDPAFGPIPDPPADIAVDTALASERLHDAVAGLASHERILLELAYFESKPLNAISRELGLPLSTVKSRLRRSFAKLRGALEGSKDVP